MTDETAAADIVAVAIASITAVSIAITTGIVAATAVVGMTLGIERPG